VEVKKAGEVLGWSRGNSPAMWSLLVSASSSSFTTLPSTSLSLEKCLFPLIFGRHHYTLGEERKTPRLIDFTVMSLLGKEQAGKISTIWF